MKSLALLVVAAAGCGGGTMQQMPTPGVATVTFVALAPTNAALTVEMGDMHLTRIAIGGDSPPPHGALMPDLGLNLTAEAGATTKLDGYPPGLYSVVLLEYHGVMVSGHWRGIPFTIHVEPVDDPQVHVHAAMGRALGDDQDADFTVSIDVNSWVDQGMDNLLLDGAAAEDGTITIDDQHNVGIAAEIAQNIGNSFSAD